MKIRNGFVSNSSSSSFIIPLKNIPSSVEEVQRMMFGDKSEVEYMYNWGDENVKLSAYTLAEIVFNSIIKSCKTTEEHITDIKENSYCCDEEIENLENVARSNPGKHIAIIEYSDNDGSYFTQLEHSGIIEATFKGSVRINQH